jgi:hypothetical protein
MALDPFATVEDVEAVWGELPVDEESKVEAWLVIASNKLRLKGRKCGIDVDQFIAGDELLSDAAKDAVVASIRRVLLNPKGLRQRSVTTTDGPFSDTGSETVDTAISSSAIYLADEDLTWLPCAPKNRLRSFSVKSGFRQ